ncbi:MAG: SurA N-terminal domain-containing protein [Nitrospiraceae bacterium]|nr:SurA N-terminal domain-containing protein [Nitrospiraceae bacterium]
MNKNYILFVFGFLFFVLCCTAHSELIDRIVAFVDDRAILLSELEETYKDTKKIKSDITIEEVLNTSINRILLLREAKKLRIEAPTKDAVLQEYIELKLRTFIKVTEEDIKDFFEKNKKEFGNSPLDEVRDKIENYIIENEVNLRLKKHIEDLKSKAYIKIQLNEQK